MNKDEWWPCSELTLQGNLTISGFAQKTWTAKPGVCEIHLHANSGVARIDWADSSVVVSSAVIQHAILDTTELFIRARQARQATSSTEPSVETPAGLEIVQTPLEDPNLARPSRADEILAEFEKPEPVTFRRRGRKPKAD